MVKKHELWMTVAEYVDWIVLREKNKLVRKKKYGKHFDTSSTGFKIPQPTIKIKTEKKKDV